MTPHDTYDVLTLGRYEFELACVRGDLAIYRRFARERDQAEQKRFRAPADCPERRAIMLTLGSLSAREAALIDLIAEYRQHVIPEEIADAED